MRPLNKAGQDLIKSYEELRLTAYDDAQPNNPRPNPVKGTVTVGWGHTGPDVYIGQQITEAMAQSYFDRDVEATLAVIDRVVKVPLTDNRRAALASLVFNIGDEAFQDSTLLRKLNAGDYASVPAEMAKWNKTTIGKKKVTSRGLIKRRAAEVALWALDDTSAGPGNQVGEAPDPKPVAKDPILTGGLIAGGGAILSDAAKQIEPLVGYSDTLKWVFLGLSLAAIAIVIATRLRHRRDEAS